MSLANLSLLGRRALLASSPSALLTSQNVGATSRNSHQSRLATGGSTSGNGSVRTTTYTTACMRNFRQRDWAAVVSVPPDSGGTFALVGRGTARSTASNLDGSRGNGSSRCGRGQRRRTVSTHRDGHRGGGRCGAGRDGGRSGHRVGAAGARDEELGCLRVDYVDIGSVDGVAFLKNGQSLLLNAVLGEGGRNEGATFDLQLESIRTIRITGDPHRGLPSSGLEIQVQLLVVRGPVDKVDQIHTECLRVGIDAGPGEVKGRALGQGRVGGRVGELNSGREVGAEGEGGEDTHFNCFVFLGY